MQTHSYKICEHSTENELWNMINNFCRHIFISPVCLSMWWAFKNNKLLRNCSLANRWHVYFKRIRSPNGGNCRKTLTEVFIRWILQMCTLHLSQNFKFIFICICFQQFSHNFQYFFFSLVLHILIYVTCRQKWQGMYF